LRSLIIFMRALVFGGTLYGGLTSSKSKGEKKASCSTT